MQKLMYKNDIILCGDLNCAHTPFDVARLQIMNNSRVAAFTRKGRVNFSKILQYVQLTDVFRYFHP